MIESPAFGVKDYPNLLNCSWLISTPGKTPLSLTFNDDFDLEEKDFLKVHDSYLFFLKVHRLSL